MSYSVERLTQPLTLGEGPHWDATSQTLYFLDAVSFSLHKYKPSTNDHSQASLETSPSFIIPIEGSDDKFFVGLLRDLAVVTWDGISDISKIEIIAETEPAGNRLNDGKVDFAGTLWTGSLHNPESLNEYILEDAPSTGRIISYRSGKLKYHDGGVRLSNGFAFSESLKKVYYIDSIKRTIDQFDYDVEKESISNRQSIFSLDKHNIKGLPDGQTIDADGNLWIALFNGSCVIKIDPRVPETLLQTVELPTKQVTSVAFGGPNLDELYVTTAKAFFGAEEPLTPSDGALFRITGLGVKGQAGIPFQLKR